MAFEHDVRGGHGNVDAVAVGNDQGNKTDDSHHQATRQAVQARCGLVRCMVRRGICDAGFIGVQG